MSPEVLEESGFDPLLGLTLDDRFTLVGKVGAGGMGTVYRGEQAPMNRPVGVKVLRRDLGRDPETVARFKREAHTLSKLKHPNTVTVYDFGHTDDGLLYLVMELLEGETLAARIKRDGALDVEVALRTAAGVLRSLDEAHAHGIIHRDLKPDNIFLARLHGRPEDDELAKVLDFGIAKLQHGDHDPGLDPVRTQEGTVFGTPRYMSPEQAQGRPIDGRSDLYAVGVLLFHMLTGNAPFTDDDAVVVMAHHIKTVPPPVRTLAPGSRIPESLEALVSRALAKDPDERPQTAAAFLTALEATRDDLVALRSTPPPTETVALATPAPPSRTWAAVVLGAAAFSALLAGLGWRATVGSASQSEAISRGVSAPLARAPDQRGFESPAPSPPEPAPSLAPPGGDPSALPGLAPGSARGALSPEPGPRRLASGARGRRRREGRDGGVAQPPSPPSGVTRPTPGPQRYPQWED